MGAQRPPQCGAVVRMRSQPALPRVPRHGRQAAITVLPLPEGRNRSGGQRAGRPPGTPRPPQPQHPRLELPQVSSLWVRVLHRLSEGDGAHVWVPAGDRAVPRVPPRPTAAPVGAAPLPSLAQPLPGSASCELLAQALPNPPAGSHRSRRNEKGESLFCSQLSLFIAPSAGRTAVTLSPGSAARSAPSLTVLPSGPFNPTFFSLFLCFPRTDRLPFPAAALPLVHPRCHPGAKPTCPTLPWPCCRAWRCWGGGGMAPPRLRVRLPAGLRH